MIDRIYFFFFAGALMPTGRPTGTAGALMPTGSRCCCAAAAEAEAEAAGTGALTGLSRRRGPLLTTPDCGCSSHSQQKPQTPNPQQTVQSETKRVRNGASQKDRRHKKRVNADDTLRDSFAHTAGRNRKSGREPQPSCSHYSRDGARIRRERGRGRGRKEMKEMKADIW